MKENRHTFERRAFIHEGFTPSSHNEAMPSRAHIPAFVLAVVCIAFVFLSFVVLYSIPHAQPFGHDEAVYLTKAQSWIDDSPADQWRVYRPLGMSALAWVVLQFSETETAIRLASVILGAATIGIIVLFTNRITNIWVAITSGVVVGASALFMEQAPQFLNDIPSSAFMIAALLCIYAHYESDGRSRIIYVVPFLIAGTFYMRYGVATALIAIAFFSYLILLQSFLRSKKARFAHLGKAILVTFALFVPHVVHSIITTRSFTGILTSAEDAAQRAYLGEGLVQYIRWLPEEIGGWPLGVLAIIGAMATPLFIALKPLRRGYMPLAWIGAIGIATFILTGLLVHAEARYVFFPMVLLMIVGIASIYFALSKLSIIVAALAMLLITAAALYFGWIDYSTILRYNTRRDASPVTLAYTRAHAAVRTDAGGEVCTLLEAQFRPRASWYTRCTILVPDDATLSANGKLEGNKVYNLVHTSANVPQLTERNAAQFGFVLSEIYRERDLPGEMIVYRVTRAPPPVATTSATTTP